MLSWQAAWHSVGNSSIDSNGGSGLWAKALSANATGASFLSSTLAASECSDCTIALLAANVSILVLKQSPLQLQRMHGQPKYKHITNVCCKLLQAIARSCLHHVCHAVSVCIRYTCIESVQ